MTEQDKPAKPKKPARPVRQSPAANEATADPTAVQFSAAQSGDPQAAAGKGPRFHFFIVDSGWNSSAAQVIRDNLDMITRFQHEDPLFILTQNQSTALMRRHPHLIGKDPILLARDLWAGGGGDGGSEYHGFHLNMGLIREPNKAVEALRKFLHLLAIHRDSADIEQDVKELLHRKGLTGAIEVLRVGSESMVG